jgi:putative ABC transport system substrate-binding protein
MAARAVLPIGGAADIRASGPFRRRFKPIQYLARVRGAAMRRREFIALAGGAAMALPRVVCAQQQIPLLVFFNSGTPSTQVKNLAAFRNGLKEAGLIEGQNVATEFVWAENRFDGLETLAAEVIARRPSVIVSNTLAAIRAKSSTTTIPIVFTTGSDPVRDGLVTSLNRPGGNVTGVVFISGTVGGKRLELLRQFVPKAGSIVMLVYPGIAETEAEREEVQTAAQAVGQQIRIVEIRNTSEIEPAVAAAAAGGAGALLIGTGPFMFNNRVPLVESIARHAIPAMYTSRENVEAGGLMSYGASISDAFHQAGRYAGRILKGEKPGDLPVVQSVKLEFMINLKTAKALGLRFHPQLLATVDEVIE